MSERSRWRWPGVLVPLAVIAAWQLAVSMGLLRFEYLPAPDAILAALLTEIRSGEVGRAGGHTLGVVGVASITALIVGTALGAAFGLLPRVRCWAEASVEVLRTVPAIALIPLAVFTFGPGADAEMMLAGYAASWPMVLNTAGAVTSVHPRQYDVARTLHLSRWATFRTIVVPTAAPVWLVGARLSVILALLVSIVVEMVITPRGLGGAMIQSLNGLDPARMWAYAFVCGVIGVTLNLALRSAVRVALPGRPEGIPSAPISRVRIAPPRGLAPLVVLLVVWQLLAEPDSLTSPPPTQWFVALAGLHGDGTLIPAIAHTLVTFVAGLAMATAVGGLLGAAVGASQSVGRALSPTLDFVAAIPGAALVPVLVLLLGPNLASGIAAVALIVTWPLLLSTAAARRAVPPVRMDVARTVGLSPLRRWCSIVLPSLLPGVLLGVRVSSALALIIALLTDIFGSGAGIGRLLVLSQQHFDAAAAWGLLLIVGGIGYVSNVGLAATTRIVTSGIRQVASAG